MTAEGSVTVYGKYGDIYVSLTGLVDNLWDKDELSTAESPLHQDDQEMDQDGQEDRYALAPEEGGGHMYGVDWADLDRPALVQHHHAHHPLNMAEVVIDKPACPIGPREAAWLREVLTNLPDSDGQDEMALVWQKMLETYEVASAQPVGHDIGVV
ncbi:hypothetical protein DACRYDRAFT_107026 [Dacryopinax primogenitus]|uniref:Uncharacterized protein n=1 Tax=Dacryopinax primogenitus (strain DJM 731) TaxID=1858805 RepID=M5G1J3_DACPD|nr:uncharacterized protein DACRYDRAFT_107026 [Dacryopinax primogenitus]EJU02080.1 hypothetical protein DACRYDRAFT_107026 [Dacryopinax primogenitus]